MPPSVDHLLNLTVVHQRMSAAMAKGRATVEPTTINPALKARKHTPSARELEQAARMEADAQVVFYFRPDAGVLRDDRIVSGSTTYLVTAVLPPSVAHHLKVFAKDMQHGQRAT